MNTVTKKEIKDAKMCIMEIIKDCKSLPHFFYADNLKSDIGAKEDSKTVFKSENIQIDFTQRYTYFKVTTDQHTFTLLEDEYEALCDIERSNRRERRNRLLIKKNAVTDKEYNAALDCVSKLVKDFAVTPAHNRIFYGFDENDDMIKMKTIIGLSSEFRSDNIEICVDYVNQDIHVFTDPETFSRLEAHHNECINNYRFKDIKSKPTVDHKPVESESKPESEPNGLESLNTEASAIVKAYNTVNEVLNTLQIGSDYRSDYSDRSYLYVSRAELMGIGLSALLTPDGDYSKTNMLKYAEHTENRYYYARGIFPPYPSESYKLQREYYAATLRYLFVCIVQNGLDAEYDKVVEFKRWVQRL